MSDFLNMLLHFLCLILSKNNKKTIKRVIKDTDAVKATKYFVGNICALIALNNKIISNIINIKIETYGTA